MKKNRFDKDEIWIIKILVVVLICSFFYQFKVPPLFTCIFIAVGYLAYDAYKK